MRRPVIERRSGSQPDPVPRIVTQHTKNCILVAEGDSLSTNFVGELSWFTQMPQPAGMQKFAVAAGGRTMETIAIESQLQTRVLSKYTPGIPNIASVWAGINDFNTGGTGQEVYDNLVIVRDLCVAAGFVFWTWYVMESGAVVGSEETERLAFNTLLTANIAAFQAVGEVIDPREIAPDPYNAPYWRGGADLTHLTTEGQALLLPQVNAAFARSVP